MKPTLEQFLNSPDRNAWVVFKSSNGHRLESYVRKGPRCLEDKSYAKVLDRANTNLTGAKALKQMMASTPDGVKYMAGTGAYREFDQHMLELAKQYGFDAIFVEQVLNPHLPDVLVRYGYTRISGLYSLSFYKILS